MNRLTVKQQLSFAFALLVAAVILVSVVALNSLRAADDRFSGYLEGFSARQDMATELRILTNRRAIAVRDMTIVKTAADLNAAKAAALQAHEEMTERLDQLKKAVAQAPEATDQERALFAALADVDAKYRPIASRIVELAASDRQDEAESLLLAQCRPQLAAMLAAARSYIDYTQSKGQEAVQASNESYAQQRNWLIALSIAAVIVATLLGWVITRRLTRALGTEPATLGEVAERVARGDLSPVEGADNAPPSSVLASMGQMQRQLVGLIGQVRASADSIATASAQIAHGNMDLSSRTEEQASALEQTAASMEELGATVRQNADNAHQANQLAQNASDVAQRGGEVVSQVVRTMQGINDSSRRIGDIIGVIDGIAFQTNILALNAAVEAARAGEQGRGFAVVAAEVRSLASRSAGAAKEIKQLIDESVQRVAEGSALVDQAGATMQDVVGSIRRVTDIVGEISAAGVEQSTGVAQVGEAVTQMDRATQENAALVEESAAAADSLKQQASQLVDAVAVFRTGAAADAQADASRLIDAARSSTSAVAVAPKTTFQSAARAAIKKASTTAAAAPRRAEPVLDRPRAAVPVPAPTPRPAPATVGNDDEWSEF